MALALAASTPSSLAVVKVLFVTHYDLSAGSGADVATRAVVRALGRQSGVELTLLAPVPRDGGDLASELPVTRWVRLPPRSGLSSWSQVATAGRVWRRCRRLLGEEGFGIVAVRYGRFFLPSALLFPREGSRLVLLIRGTMPSSAEGPVGRLLGGVTRRLSFAAARRADRLLFAFRDAVELLGGKVAPERVRVVPNAADLDAFPCLEREAARRDFPGGYPWSVHRKVVGFVGSLRPRHRLEELLRASERLRDCGVDHGVLIVGDGPVRPRLEALVRDLHLQGSVYFAGRVPHESVGRYVSACDLLYALVDPARPSNPIKVYEALAAGRPVVTSPRPELGFVEREHLGIVTDAGDPEGIAESMEKGLFLRWTSAEARRAREHVRAHHTWDVLAREILDRRSGEPQPPSVQSP